MRGLTIATLFVLSVFAAQLVRIQGLDAAAVADEALKQRTATVALPALRGKITSSDGVVLASSRERVAVVADPQAVCTYGRRTTRTCDDAGRASAVGAAADRLSPVMGIPRERLVHLLTRPRRYVVIDKKVTPLTWRKIAALGIPGVYKDTRTNVAVPERVYPQGSTAASLVGYVNNAGEPGGGVELMRNSVLEGRTGKAVYEQDPSGAIIPGGRQRTTPAVDGRDVTLTINSNLQWYAQNALAQKIRETRALSGTVVVMNARTGDLLTVASYPTFDPNDVGHATGSLASLAFTDVFEPGSTAKIMTISAAIEERKVTPSTPVLIPNRLHRFDTWFRDSHDHPTEYRTVAGTLAESSNLGTVLVGETMTPKTLETYYRRFGLGARSGSGFPGESKGLLAPSERWSGTQRSTVMFGQGVSVTAVQAASVFQTIANGGVRVTPRLIAGSRGADGAWTKAPPSTGTAVVSPRTAAEVSRMLEGVVSKEGTAPQAQIPGYRVAGKTGTADRFDSRTHGYSGKTASFIGYAPADKPELVVAVILQRPIKGYFGGSVAGPVFHDVMTYALQEMRVPPTGTRRGSITITPDAKEAAHDPHLLQDRPRGSGG